MTNFEAFRWNLQSSTNPEIGRSEPRSTSHNPEGACRVEIYFLKNMVDFRLLKLILFFHFQPAVQLDDEEDDNFMINLEIYSVLSYLLLLFVGLIMVASIIDRGKNCEGAQKKDQHDWPYLIMVKNYKMRIICKTLYEIFLFKIIY